MRRVHKIFQIDSFTTSPFQGNPAAVTFGDDLNEEEMKAIAREMNLAETAFISGSDVADYKLQWFTPTSEVELCGHATIATLHFLSTTKLKQKEAFLTFETLSGVLKCSVKDDLYSMQIPVYKMEDYSDCKQELLGILNLHPTDVPDEIPFQLLENGNLYVYVSHLSALHKIGPDFKALINFCIKNGKVKGVVAYTDETIEEENSAHLRYFVPMYGIDEDIVTGSANGPLLPVMLKSGFLKNYKNGEMVTFEQGDVLGRKGRVKVYFTKEGNELYISGNAVTVIEGELIF